ncbi:hypothetical protein ACJIZ3_009902 [Penstemon smallii]|uniref:Uncharacterized protein n=1 Tax=Penstemon smallii TaxID=265156 RepID=A0ABD3TEX3_9LAMI
MAFLLNKTSLSSLRLRSQRGDDSLTLSRRGFHVEPGAREKAWQHYHDLDLDTHDAATRSTLKRLCEKKPGKRKRKTNLHMEHV